MSILPPGRGPVLPSQALEGVQLIRDVATTLIAIAEMLAADAKTWPIHMPGEENTGDRWRSFTIGELHSYCRISDTPDIHALWERAQEDVQVLIRPIEWIMAQGLISGQKGQHYETLNPTLNLPYLYTEYQSVSQWEF